MKDDYPNEDGPSVVRVFYRWPDGHRELHYERPYPDKIVDEVKVLQAKHGDKCPYELEYS